MTGPGGAARPGTIVAAGALALAATVLAAAEALAAGPCSDLGWRPVTIGGQAIVDVSTLAGAPGSGRLYAGSRRGTGNVMLHSGTTLSHQWQAETAFTGIPVTDALVTPGRSTEAWISTYGSAPTYNGPVLGRSSELPFGPRGTLRSWFMALAATDSDVFVAVSKPDDRGVYRWDETGGDWTRLGATGIDTVVFRAFEAGPDGRLWLGTDARGLWQSSDGGSDWQAIEGGGDWTVWSVAAAPSDGDVVLVGLGPPDGQVGVGGFAKGIRRSQDGGATWQDVTPALAAAAPNETITALAFSRSTPGLAFAAGWFGGLFVTRDGGMTWAPYPTPPGQPRFYDALLLVPSGDTCELLYAAGSDGLWARNLAPARATVHLPAVLRGADAHSP